MTDDGVLKDHSKKGVAQSLYETPTEEEKKEYEALKFIEIETE